LLFVLGVQGQDLADDGILLFEQGDYTAAVEKLNAATAAKKDDDTAWVYLGVALLKLDKRKESADAFKKLGAGQKIVVNGLDSDFKFLSKPRPGYTEKARVNRTSGHTRLAVEFLANGKVGTIGVIDSLPDGLIDQSISATPTVQVQPGDTQGTARHIR
ncbi:MAG: tetratricopeptide repeat protein, partial [Pyrinomonadaceae bacterium]